MSNNAANFPAEANTSWTHSSPESKPNLDSFEELMRAMDAELARSRSGQTQPSTRIDKGKDRAAPESINQDDEDDDIEAAMEAELNGLLEQHGDDDDDLEGGDTDYNLIKNFLESFKSQAGLSGPVGNLAGRLQPGWSLPRDTS